MPAVDQSHECGSGGYWYLAPATPTAADDVGIALSGGGVRAACLALGALQLSEERRLLRRARYVTAVSGGSYIAAAYLASRAVPPSKVGHDGEAGEDLPWARGSREEQHLKRNLHYLAESVRDAVMAVTHFTCGLLLNLVPLVAAVALVSTLLGLLLNGMGLLARTENSMSAPHRPVRLAVALALLVGAAVCEGRFEGGSPFARVRLILYASAVIGVVPDLVLIATQVRSARVTGIAFIQQLGATGLAVAATLAMVLSTQWSVVGGRARRVVRSLTRVLFALSWTGGMLMLVAYATAYGVRGQDSWKAWAIAVTAGAVLMLCGVFLHANTTSLHDKYARRLARAYVVRASDQGDDGLRIDRVALADLAAEGFPELVICAAVNLRERESALGEGCASFVFTPTIVGSPALRYLPTKKFSNELSRRSRIDHRLHLSSLIAASGAAVAPNMGRYSRKGSRLALSILNLRLGLWIVNPFLTQVPPHQPLAGRRSPRRWIADGWYEPGPLATIREALGALSVHNQALFISDGGHWDNSGIVELLRRRCSHIIAMDASNDPARLSNILRVISLARTELGVEFDADATLLESEDPVQRIAFSYPEDTRASPKRYLVLLRTFMSDRMPADIVAMARVNSAFPRHSTSDQFFSARESEAYIALGRWLCHKGIEIADLPPVTEVDIRTAEEMASYEVPLDSALERGLTPSPPTVRT